MIQRYDKKNQFALFPHCTCPTRAFVDLLSLRKLPSVFSIFSSVQGGVQDTRPARAKEAHTGCRRLCSAHRGPPAHHLRWSSWADAPNLDKAAPSHPLADSLRLPRPPPLLLHNHPAARSCAQTAAHRQGAHRADTSSSDGTQAATVLLRLRRGVPGFPIHGASLPTSQT